MKRFVLFLAIVTALLCSGNRAVSKDRHTVKWVHDGDTIVLNDGRCIRYIGINTPEIDHHRQQVQPFGNEAAAYNKALVLSKSVRLQFDVEKQDRYHRFLAYVFLSDHTFVNNDLIRKGYAYCLFRFPNITYHQLFLRSQRRAMAERQGMWKGFKAKYGPYLGNNHSKRFHVPSCLFSKKISTENRIRFSTKWEAFWNGFGPCKGCIDW